MNLPLKPRLPRGLLFALLITAAVYVPALGAFFHQDDWGLLFNTATKHINPWGFGNWFYRPLLLIAFSSLYKLFGLNAPLWHASIIILHLLNVALLYSLIRRTGFGPTAATVGAVLFGVYPTNPDAVTWLCAVSGVMSAFWGLIAAHTAISVRINPFMRGLICAAAFMVAMLSKEDAASLILVLPFLPLFVDHKHSRDELIRWACSCVLLIAALWSFQHLEMQAHQNMGNPRAIISLEVFRRATMFSLWSLRDIMTLSATSRLWSVAMISILPLLLWWRSPSLKLGMLWFFGTTLGIGMAMGTLSPADRYDYIPSIGLAICLAGLIDRLGSRKQSPSFDTWLLIGAGLLMLGNIPITMMSPAVTAVLAFCYWTDSTPTTTNPSTCLPVVALSTITRIIEPLLINVGVGYYPDWAIRVSALVFCGIILGVRALRGQQSRWSETLLCCCIAVWPDLPGYQWFLAAILGIEILRAGLVSPIKMNSRLTGWLAGSSRYRVVLVSAAALLPCIVYTCDINVGWYKQGERMRTAVRQTVPLLKQLPKGANVEILDKAGVGWPELKFYNATAALFAKRPDLHIYANLPSHEPAPPGSCRLAYYKGKKPVMSQPLPAATAPARSFPSPP